MPKPGIPESFQVLMKELQSLGLDIQVLDEDGNEIGLKRLDETTIWALPDLGRGRDVESELAGDTAHAERTTIWRMRALTDDVADEDIGRFPRRTRRRGFQKQEGSILWSLTTFDSIKIGSCFSG